MATPVQVHADHGMVPLKVLIPRSWRDALADAADTQGLSMAALVRLILGGFLRNRLPSQ